MGGEQDEGDRANLFGDKMEKDYRANPELDRSSFMIYFLFVINNLILMLRLDPAQLDEEDYEALKEGELI